MLHGSAKAGQFSVRVVTLLQYISVLIVSPEDTVGTCWNLSCFVEARGFAVHANHRSLERRYITVPEQVMSRFPILPRRSLY